ncbi:MAG: glycosyltransferase family 4 protein [Anaerolineae bacterium]|nr:glycosyltransferase family 4 protein [Anaerolineae bacterium]
MNASLLCLGENYRSAGIHRYIYHLLCRLPDADAGLSYTAFLHDPRFTPRQGMRVRRPIWSTITPYKRIVWEQLVAPVVLRQEKVDLLHAMAFVSPVLSKRPTVVTVFDVSFLQFPQAFSAAKRIYLRWMTHLSVQRATQVIAISDHTRRDVIERFTVPGERVKTVYCGVDASFRPLPEKKVRAFRQKKGLPAQSILFLGTIEPRKNISQLIKAFAHLIATSGQDFADLCLVIAGGKGWFFEPIFALVEELELTHRVRFTGYVPEEEKCGWYNVATCFCYPSLYEGFGLSPLEAMACGTPVITSNVSSLPEVVGDAGLTVAPDDVRGLSDALYRVLSDASLRDELVDRGKKRAATFTWDKAARQTAQIYRQAWWQSNSMQSPSSVDEQERVR